MADCEVIERSRARIGWLVNELGDELRRNSAKSCPLAPEANGNTGVVLLLLLLLLQARTRGRGRGGLSPPSEFLEVKKQCDKKYISKTNKCALPSISLEL